MKYTVQAGGSEFQIEIDRQGELRVDGEVVAADLQSSSDPTLYSLLLGHRSHELRMESGNGLCRVLVEGQTYEVKILDERERRLSGVRAPGAERTGEVAVKSPMPGIVLDVAVKEGDAVAAGDTLVVVESMKMHNELKAPRAGTVHAVRVARGTKVAQNAILVTLA